MKSKGKAALLDFIWDEMPNAVPDSHEKVVVVEIRRGLVVMVKKGTNIRKIRKKYAGK